MARRGRRRRKAKRKGRYTISVVAERFGVHPQTLRLYEREGLIEPARTSGNTRLYTDEDVAQLEIILSLTRELGVNLAGVEIILNMRKKMDAMQRQIREFVQFVNQSMTVADAAEDPLTNALIPLRTRMAPQRGQSADRDRPPRADDPEIVDV